jgi:hypothetical protein
MVHIIANLGFTDYRVLLKSIYVKSKSLLTSLSKKGGTVPSLEKGAQHIFFEGGFSFSKTGTPL